MHNTITKAVLVRETFALLWTTHAKIIHNPPLQHTSAPIHLGMHMHWMSWTGAETLICRLLRQWSVQQIKQMCVCVHKFICIERRYSNAYRQQTMRAIARAKDMVYGEGCPVSGRRFIFAYWLAVAPPRGNAVFLYQPIWVENPLLFSITHTQIIGLPLNLCCCCCLDSV